MADAQHGLVRQDQAHAVGYDRWALQRLVESGRFERLTCRVLRQAGSARTTQQLHLAAVFDAEGGAVLADLSAAAAWEIPGFRVREPVEVTRVGERTGLRPRLATIRPVRFVTPDHTTMLAGVPTLTLPVTLYRLAARLAFPRFERAADTVCGRCPMVLEALHLLLPQLQARGRNGITAMREFLAPRPVGYQGPHTGVEARVNQVLRDAGEEPLENQVDLGGHSWVGRVDLVDRSVPFVLEVNSRTYHSSMSDRRDDERRYAALRAAGFQVVVVDDDVVWHRPAELVALVRHHRNRGPQPG